MSGRYAPLLAALDRAGIAHRDLAGHPMPEASRVILERLRAAGFDGYIDDATHLDVAVALIDEWNVRR